MIPFVSKHDRINSCFNAHRRVNSQPNEIIAGYWYLPGWKYSCTTTLFSPFYRRTYFLPLKNYQVSRRGNDYDDEYYTFVVIYVCKLYNNAWIGYYFIKNIPMYWVFLINLAILIPLIGQLMRLTRIMISIPKKSKELRYVNLSFWR